MPSLNQISEEESISRPEKYHSQSSLEDGSKSVRSEKDSDKKVEPKIIQAESRQTMGYPSSPSNNAHASRYSERQISIKLIGSNQQIKTERENMRVQNLQKIFPVPNQIMKR